MTPSEQIYQDIQSLPEPLIQEVLQFVEFLKFKQQLVSNNQPNDITIKAMQAAERGEYEAIYLQDLALSSDIL